VEISELTCAQLIQTASGVEYQSSHAEAGAKREKTKLASPNLFIYFTKFNSFLEHLQEIL
jgi:hypothetical protein